MISEVQLLEGSKKPNFCTVQTTTVAYLCYLWSMGRRLTDGFDYPVSHKFVRQCFYHLYSSVIIIIITTALHQPNGVGDIRP